MKTKNINEVTIGAWFVSSMFLVSYSAIKLGKELYESHKFHKELYKEES